MNTLVVLLIVALFYLQLKRNKRIRKASHRALVMTRLQSRAFDRECHYLETLGPDDALTQAAAERRQRAWLVWVWAEYPGQRQRIPQGIREQIKESYDNGTFTGSTKSYAWKLLFQEGLAQLLDSGFANVPLFPSLVPSVA